LYKARLELREERAAAVELSERTLLLEEAARQRATSHEAAAAAGLGVADTELALAQAAERVLQLETELHTLRAEVAELKTQV
jgi:hypothetical protein